jgi:hypothetical protein
MFAHDPAPTLDDDDDDDDDGDDENNDKDSVNTFGLAYDRPLLSLSPVPTRAEDDTDHGSSSGSSNGHGSDDLTSAGEGEGSSVSGSGGSGDSGGETHVYLVLGRLFKLHPDFDGALLEVLHRDQQSVIALIQERQELWTQAVWRRLVAAAEAREAAERSSGPSQTSASEGVIENINGANSISNQASGSGGGSSTAVTTPLFNARACLGRLRFIHHWNYIRVLRLPQTLAVLDTWPYGGCLTALEALSNGRPVITLPSDFARGRFALAMYRQMGLARPAGATATANPTSATASAADATATASGAPPTTTPQQQKYPWGLVASDREDFVRCVTALGTDREHRRFVTGLVRAAYPECLHRNKDAGGEWARFFLKLALLSEAGS